MKDAFKMGLRSLLYRKKQYRSLFIVCVFGVGISLFASFLVKGMINSLEYKAKIYYGGDFQFFGENPDDNQKMSERTIAKLKTVFPKDTIITPRYDLNPEYASLYFEGMEVQLRMIKGINFDAETEHFKKLNYKEGDASDIKGTNGILISEKIANTLSVHAGDSVTFLIENSEHETDTMDVIVKGIFIDSSFFGIYTTYMDIDFLKKANKYPITWCNRIAISLKNGAPTEHQVKHYQAALEKLFTMHPQVSDKKQFYRAEEEWEYYDVDGNFKPLYALIRLNANLDSLQVLIDAMNIVTFFVIIMLVIIIVVGIASTFRVIIMKRINEIGIYKAIGMQRSKIYMMILAETLILVAFGCVGGFIFSGILVLIANHINLSFIPAFDLFLTNGVLAPVISPKLFLVISVSICVTTLLAVLFAIKKSVQITPCEALAATE